MRHITDAGLALIKRFEGFSPAAYLCPAGYPTIGYGHVVLPAERTKFVDGISHAQGDELLWQDLQIAEAAVLRLVSVPLTDNQFDALVSFTFNLGVGALQRSTLRRLVNRGHHDDVPREFMKWVRCGLHILPGLVCRRKAEALLYGNLLHPAAHWPTTVSDS